MAPPKVFRYVPHPHRNKTGPAKVNEQHDRSNPAARFNAALAVGITKGVGTIWCAYAFALIALVSLPAAIHSHDPVVLVQWLSSVFLQLVLLAIILVGQGVQAAAADKRASDTYVDAEAILHEAAQIQAHLQAQDSANEAVLLQLKNHDTRLAAIAASLGSLAAPGTSLSPEKEY